MQQVKHANIIVYKKLATIELKQRGIYMYIVHVDVNQ